LSTPPVSRCNLPPTLVCHSLVVRVNLTTNPDELSSHKEIEVAPQFFSSALMC
jgi:hypothetical protein